jgi:hypothetical protein
MVCRIMGIGTPQKLVHCTEQARDYFTSSNQSPLLPTVYHT